MPKEIKIYCRNRIINRGEVIGTTSTDKGIKMIISDYMKCIGIEPNEIESLPSRDGVVFYHMENVSHLVFISREEDSFYDFY